MRMQDVKLMLIGLLFAPIAFVLLLLVLGICSALFNGVFWLIAAHLTTAIVCGVALWIVGAFIIGAAVNAWWV